MQDQVGSLGLNIFIKAIVMPIVMMLMTPLALKFVKKFVVPFGEIMVPFIQVQTTWHHLKCTIISLSPLQPSQVSSHNQSQLSKISTNGFGTKK